MVGERGGKGESIKEQGPCRIKERPAGMGAILQVFYKLA